MFYTSENDEGVGAGGKKRLGRPPKDPDEVGVRVSFWVFGEQDEALVSMRGKDPAVSNDSDGLRESLGWAAVQFKKPGYDRGRATQHVSATKTGTGGGRDLSVRLRRLDEENLAAVIAKVWPPRAGLASGIEDLERRQSHAARFAIRWYWEALRRRTKDRKSV